MTVGHVWLGWALGVASVELEAARRGRTKRPGRVSPNPSVGVDRAYALEPAAGLGAMRVLVVRPCAGDAAWIARALASLATARHSFQLSCRFAVATPDDAATPIAEAAVRTLMEHGLDAAVVVTGAREANRKAAQLAAVIGAASAHDVVIVADSDVDLAGVDLDALVAPLSRGAAAVWAPPVDAGPEASLGDRASAAILNGSLHAFPLLATLDGRGFVGKLFAVRADALEAAGGFGALVTYLGEDIELARRLRALGEEVHLAPMVARSLATGRSWDEVAARFARWITVIRAQRPLLLASYPLLLWATVPVLLAAIVAPGLSAPVVFATVGCVLGARLLVSRAASARAGRRWRLGRALVDVVLADALLAQAYAKALASRRFVWCGVELTVDGAGRLQAARS